MKNYWMPDDRDVMPDGMTVVPDDMSMVPDGMDRQEENSGLHNHGRTTGMLCRPAWPPLGLFLDSFKIFFRALFL